MFKPSEVVTQAFSVRVLDHFARVCPQSSHAQREAMGLAMRAALARIARTNALYSNIDAAVLTTDVALAIAEGRQIARGDVDTDDWVHFVTAALCHLTGFVRETCPGDDQRQCVIDQQGRTVRLERGRTDGCLMPWAAARSQLFVRDHFRDHSVIDGERVAELVAATSFPVPDAAATDATSWQALLRAAQHVAHVADPRFHARLQRFYRQLSEAGVAQELGYANAADVRDSYPRRFWEALFPHIAVATDYLKFTGDGQIWLARMNAHMLEEERRSAQAG